MKKRLINTSAPSKRQFSVIANGIANIGRRADVIHPKDITEEEKQIDDIGEIFTNLVESMPKLSRKDRSILNGTLH